MNAARNMAHLGHVLEQKFVTLARPDFHGTAEPPAAGTARVALAML
jgi:hypothetical protein